MNSDNNHTHEIGAVLLVALGLLVGASLLTYHPEDPSWFTLSSSQTGIQNAVGRVGAFLSESLFQLLGVAGYFIPVFLLSRAIHTFKENPFSYRAGGGSLLFLITLSTLSEIRWSGSSDLIPSNLRGGLIGKLLSEFLLHYFSLTGTVILVLPLLLISVQLVMPFSPLALFQWLFLRANRLVDLTTLGVHFIQRKLKQKLKEHPKKHAIQVSSPPPTISRAPDRPSPPTETPPKPEVEIAAPIRRGSFRLPPLSLLPEPAPKSAGTAREDWVARSQVLEKKFLDFGISGKVTEIHPGPVVTMFEFEPAPGIKLNRITTLSDDIALAMKALQVRIIAPLPAKSTVGIEIPNVHREGVLLKEVLASSTFSQIPSKLRMALGKDIFGNPVAADLAKMPHLLIAGSTGSGKSVGMNAMVLSLLFTCDPTEVKMLMIDPKMLEFSLYDGIPHLISPVIVRARAASSALKKMVSEMERRYTLLSEKGVRNIEGYNAKIAAESNAHALTPDAKKEEVPLPYIVIFIDELADLMMVAPRDVEESLTRLAQMARAAGIHLVLATQRPSVDVITGVIKANFPARIAYCVASKVDSRTILDANGAEQLLGKGDMLYLSAGTGKIQRIHGAYVSEEEAKEVVAFIKKQASPHYEVDLSQEPPAGDTTPVERDDLYENARELVIETGQASATYLQRKMKMGYPRAARVIEMLEEDGVIGPATGGKPREILIKKENATQ